MVRPPPPPLPGPFSIRLSAVRLGVEPAVTELLAELRRLEAASAASAAAAQESSEAIERALRTAEDSLGRAQAELQAAVQFLDTGEQQLQRFASIRDAAQGHEAAARAGLQSLSAASLEVCALDTGPGSGAVSTETVAGLESKLGDAEATTGEIVASKGRCEAGAEQLRTEIGEWQTRWQSVIEGATEAAERETGEAVAALLEATSAEEELGAKALRLDELEDEAEPLIEELEERAAAWTALALAEIREEVLTEERRLAGLISDRVTAVLERYDFQSGAIQTLENALDLAHADLDSLARETDRVRQSLLPRLTQILSATDLAVESAAECVSQADRAAATARGCLERIRARVGVEEETLISVPDLAGRSDDLAIAWLEELELRAFVSSESTLDDQQVGKVARQSPAPGAQLRPQETVSLWVYVSAVKPEPRTSVPVVTQARCDVDWPGTNLVTDSGGGNPRCECPSGTAWSRVESRCLSLTAGDCGSGASGASRDCSHRWGTVFDSRTGKCECLVGSWVDGQGCVDAMVAERQKEIDNARTAADCENVLANVRTFRSHPDSFQRQLAASAESKARALGCDPSAIQSAIAEGDRRVWKEPPKPSKTEVQPIGPGTSEGLTDLEIFKPSLRVPPGGQQPGGQGSGTASGGDCSRCRTLGGIDEYIQFQFENKGHCKYHPNRLGMFCDPDPECVHWRAECARQKKIFDECMAACSG